VTSLAPIHREGSSKERCIFVCNDNRQTNAIYELYILQMRQSCRHADSIASPVHSLWSMDTKDNFESMQCSSNLLICLLKNKPAADGNSSK
jgi:hypothetical protein